MAEQYTDETLTPVLRHWICSDEQCDYGKMEAVEYRGAPEGRDWLHKCDCCGREAFSRHKYPRIAYLPTEPVEAG